MCFLAGIVLVSCTKENDNTSKQKFEILSGEVLEVDLGSMPVEGMIFIKEQAKHSAVSEIEFNIYRYKSQDGFQGNDFVVIERRASRGDSNFDLISWLEIEIRVR